MTIVTHLMRAPVVGGSELETLAIVRAVRDVRHRVLFPRRFSGRTPSIAADFPADVPLLAVDDVERALTDDPPELLHVQFPFVLVDRPAGHDSVLELTRLPDVPTLFTVHAAVNVPVVAGIDYLFHTSRQAGAFAGVIAPERITICPSLVEGHDDEGCDTRSAGDRDAPVRVLFVARHEDAKFHPELAHLLERLLDADPRVELRFVGRPPSRALPVHARLTAIDCPAPDLPSEYRAADVFAHLPDPRLHETWCRTVTEAMGFGLPCVVSSHGAMSHQVRDGVEGAVVDDLAQAERALRELVADPARRIRQGAAGRLRARAFRRDALTILPALYARLVAAAPPRATRA